MDATQISVAIVMVGVTIAIMVWFRSSQAAASAGRMVAMMTRIGLDPGSAMSGSSAIGKEARRRCTGCAREDLCGRWLAGEIEGSHSFCPNARIFHVLAVASRQPSATTSHA